MASASRRLVEDQPGPFFVDDSCIDWYSWPEQLASLERLLDFSFTSVLPDHGRRFHAESPAAMRRALAELLERLGRDRRVAHARCPV